MAAESQWAERRQDQSRSVFPREKTQLKMAAAIAAFRSRGRKVRSRLGRVGLERGGIGETGGWVFALEMRRLSGNVGGSARREDPAGEMGEDGEAGSRWGSIALADPSPINFFIQQAWTPP